MYTEAKRLLRSVGWLHYVNATAKCWRTRSSYHHTVSYYRSLLADASTSNRDTKSQRPLRWLRESRPPRIFFLGTDEEQDRSGLVQALARIGRVTCFTREDGSYGQNDPAPYWERRARNTERLLSLVADMAERGEAPDILVAQTWASLIVPAALSEIRSRYGTFIINISMDDRHQYWGCKVRGEWNGVFPLIPHLDLALTAAPECVSWYEKEGCPALYFPEASDPEIFHPMPELPKLWGVSFVGARYGIRRELVVALRNAGIRVAAYGQGWENGRLPTAEVPKLFAQSKIVLGVGTIGHCRDFYALKLRDFDGPMSGTCYLTHDNLDLHDLYAVGEEIVTYSSVAECVERTRWLLAHDAEREEIARCGRERALRDHTWDKRFAGLMEKLSGGLQVVGG